MAATATQRAKSTIHVSSLPAETTKDLLLSAFIPFGEIVDIQIPLNDEDNSIRGFAYIEFESADDAAEAIFNMNDSELYNRVIKVDIAKPHRGLAGLDSSLPVWQQEEWIKANVNKDGDGAPRETPDAMQGLEMATQHK